MEFPALKSLKCKRWVSVFEIRELEFELDCGCHIYIWPKILALGRRSSSIILLNISIAREMRIYFGFPEYARLHFSCIDNSIEFKCANISRCCGQRCSCCLLAIIPSLSILFIQRKNECKQTVYLPDEIIKLFKYWIGNREGETKRVWERVERI